MGLTLAQKLIKSRLVEGDMTPGSEIGVKIDQTLIQDATGTMACLEFEAMGIERVKTELSVAYIDHNTLQTGFENADDHRFIRSVAKKRGAFFSRPGNGVCHQVHLERFGKPGSTLIGSDSHTPTGGALGALAIGAGGLDAAVAMGGGTYYMAMPEITLVRLSGALSPWVSAKDIILEVLRIMSVKGGVGRIIEYGGDGVKTLSIPERATIANMGAETGATTSVFPSDEITRKFLEAQGRGRDWKEILPDEDAEYDEIIDLDLSKLVPLIAAPHMPDNVKTVEELNGLEINQVCIGSCTNSSLIDLLKTAAVLRGKRISPNVSLTVSPGSMQVLNMISLNGALSDILGAGARLLECACGPCIGMGQAPQSKGVTLRTFNRNFEGRSGTADARIYLVSAEVAAASALKGVLTDPRTLGRAPEIVLPERFIINDNLIERPADPEEAKNVEIEYGPNIKPFPKSGEPPERVEAPVILKVGDDATTDHILPAGAKILPYRSNIPYLANFCFKRLDERFAERCRAAGKGFIVAGANYGQGSSREHAALVPMYLGIKAVFAKSFARIHFANLINAGIFPLTFKNPDDYDGIDADDVLALDGVRSKLQNGEAPTLENRTKGESYALNYAYSARQTAVLLAGGLLNYTKSSANKEISK